MAECLGYDLGVSRDTGLTTPESTALMELPSRPRSEAPEHACLVLISGPEIGRRVPLSEADLVIGRATEADLLIDSDGVSRIHAVLTRRPQGFVLRDQDSTNGTFVNDQPIRERMLSDGDHIRIGLATLKFLTSDNVEAQYHEEIYRLMTLDGLTQIYNRRHFEETLEREFARSRRYRSPFTLVLLDVDHFKQINDQRGHPMGDEVLRRIGALLKSKIRTNDLAARIGGEEFALTLPGTNRAGGVALAEKLRVLIADEPFRHEGKPFEVTASFGVAEYTRTMVNAESLIKLADERLYEAKRGGRNRVC
jgi:diguanylate cyclase (GGDEF)-like protein